MVQIVHRTQAGFPFGELSPRLEGDVASEVYAGGLRKAENCYIDKKAQVTNRFGMFYKFPAFNNAPVNLFQVRVRAVQTFIVEVGDEQVNIYDPTATVIPLSPVFQIATAPWTQDQVLDVRGFQTDEGQLLLVHPDRAPRVLERDETGQWTLSLLDDVQFAGPQVDDRFQPFGMIIQDRVPPQTNFHFLDTEDNAQFFREVDVGGFFRVNDVYFEVEDLTSPNRAQVISRNTPLGVSTAIGGFPIRDWSGPWVEQPEGTSEFTFPGGGGPVGAVITVDITAGPLNFSVQDVGQILNVNSTEVTQPGPVYCLILDFNSATQVVVRLLNAAVLGATPYSRDVFYRIQERNNENELVTPTDVEGAITLNANQRVFPVGIDGDVTGERGAYIYINGGIAEVTSRLNDFQVEATVLQKLERQDPSTTWGQGWSPATGFPAVGTIHQNRIFLARMARFPVRILASRTDRVFDWQLGDRDNDGLNFDLAEDTGGGIVWVKTGGDLLVGTEDSEFAVSGQPITPTQIGAAYQTGHGGRNVAPVQLDDAVIFVTRCGCELRSMQFRFDRDRFRSPPLTDFADHLFSLDNPVVDLAVMREPQQFVLAIRQDGQVNCLTIRPRASDSVLAWCPWSMEEVQSSVTYQAPTQDEVWVCVKRDIQDAIPSTQYYVEAISASAIMDAQVDPAPGQFSLWPQVFGLGHLEGEKVDVVADNGMYHGRHTVVGGAINTGSLEPQPNAIFVGLHIESTLRFQHLPVPGARGDNPGRQVQQNALYIRFHETSGGRFVNPDVALFPGPAPDSTEEADVKAEKVPETVSKWVEYKPIAANEVRLSREPVIEIFHEVPYNLEVLAITHAYQTGDT